MNVYRVPSANLRGKDNRPPLPSGLVHSIKCEYDKKTGNMLIACEILSNIHTLGVLIAIVDFHQYQCMSTTSFGDKTIWDYIPRDKVCVVGLLGWLAIQKLEQFSSTEVYIV